MAFERYYDRQEFDNRISLTELEEQYAFTLGIEIEKGEKISGNNDKAFYKANWIDRDEPPVLLIEKKRNQNIEEILFNLTLNHRHIIKTYGFVNPNGYNVKSNCVLLLQEYAKDGDLGSQLSQKFFVPKQNVFVEIFIQIADAMVFLSESKVIHGDLACRNVLLFKSDPHVPSKNLFKLIDFGLTRNNTGSLDAHTEIPVRYVASEILRSNGRSGYSEKSDVYSFGTFMWEACSFGKMPYEEIDDDDEVSRQKLAGNRLTRPNKCDPNIWKLMNLCWNDQPNNRPNFKKIHKQLKIIQNVESSLPPSKSGFSSSSMEENSSLFQIEYEICQNCDLRYTDHDSHLSNCSKHELTCNECFKTYRRGSYSNHKRKCDGVPDDVTFTQVLESSSNYNNRKALPSKNRGPSVSKYDANDSDHSKPTDNSLLTNSSYQPNRRNRINLKSSYIPDEIPTRQKPIQSQRTSVRKNSSQDKEDQLPCEICNKLFNISDLKTHQMQCLKNDNERIERRRLEIERERTPSEAECVYCEQKFSITEFDEHQNKCSSNPNNVPDQRRALSLTRSISDSNLHRRTANFTISSSSNESSLAPPKPQPSWQSTTNLRTPRTPVTNTKPAVTKKPDEPSRFRKLLSSVWPFNKKSSKN